MIYKQTRLNPHRLVFNMSLIEASQPVVKTLETCALDNATNKDLFQFMLLWWGRSYQSYYWNYLFERLPDKEMEQLSRSIPWDHPAAKQMDYYIHKKRMKGMYFKR